MNSQLLFSLKEVIISYHKHEIFHDLDLNIQRKDFIALVGKNGVGKSTLMNVISGNHEIDKGEIWSIDNISVRYFSQNLQFDNANEDHSFCQGSYMFLLLSYQDNNRDQPPSEQSNLKLL